MKNRINNSIRNISWIQLSSPEIHVVDYTNITGSKRDIEIHDHKPDNINSLLLKNNALISVNTAIFGKQALMDKENGKELPHCECVTFPSTENNNDHWMLFIEIKDCKPRNMSIYFQEAKKQIIKTIGYFREKGIIDVNRKVNAVISFPNHDKTDFYHQLIKQGERQEFLHNYKIIIKGTNSIEIKSERSIV